MNVSAGEAGKMMAEGWVMLDVRPPSEVANVSPPGGGGVVCGLCGALVCPSCTLPCHATICSLLLECCLGSWGCCNGA